MSEYHGFQTMIGPCVSKDGKPFLPQASQAVWNHSPDGFNWGYQGSGPAQLALALLMEVCSNELASILHQAFKRSVVARFAAESWDWSTEETIEWVANRPDLREEFAAK